jgi:hypothetical protein
MLRGMSDRELHDALTELIWAFEMVFHHDWDYAQTMLDPFNAMIGEGGTFLEPRVANEQADWGYRAMLLERYRKLKAVMATRGLAPTEVSQEEAIRAARAVLVCNVELAPGGGVEVTRRGPFFVVTFTRNDPPGTRGPDHDARVLVDAHTGRVTELHVAS